MFEFMTGCTNRSEPAPQPTTLLACLFLGSGAAALIYELAWFHVLRLVVGSSSISIAALLVSFMGGMGIGSVLLPRVCLLYTSPSPRDGLLSRMPSSA